MWVIAAALAAVSGSVQAATVSGRDRANILAACEQTHDTCLQSCNAAHGSKTSLFGRADYIQCTTGCDSALSACNKSVDLKATPIPANKLPQSNKLFP
jgi:hypothetical protein